MNCNEMRKPFHRRPKYVLAIVLAVTACCWLVFLAYVNYPSSCNGLKYQEFICAEYVKGSIAGELCTDMCSKGTVNMNKCVKPRSHSGNMAFTSGQIVLKVGRDIFNRVIDGINFDATFNEPTQGTSMEQFRQMVQKFLIARLGDTSDHHAVLMKKIVDTADVNVDGKVSLAEAKTIWSLIHNNEFFLSLIFQGTEHDFFPKLQTFCGNIYAMKSIPYTYLYDKEHSASVSSMVPQWAKLWQPSWKNRAKISVGILEFVLAVYQHTTEGSFYLCNIDQLNIGYNEEYDIKITDLSLILSAKLLEESMSGQSCDKSKKCQFSKYCHTVCDTKNNTCTHEVIYPNLHHICAVIKEYIFADAQRTVRAELHALFTRCNKLDNTQMDSNAAMEHSLVLNELKSLLWKHIQK